MKKKKQPVLEAITPSQGGSIKVERYSDSCNDSAAAWHFHPEMEIVYVDGGAGKRHIGNHISYYQDGDLIFIGANLPHFGFTDRLTGNKSEVVIQAREELFGNSLETIPEMEPINRLFRRSRQGIIFYGETKKKVGVMIDRLPELQPYERLLGFLQILGELAASKEYELLNVDQVILETKPQDTQRLDGIYALVRKEFTRPIALAEVADLVSMTEQAFSRYFKQKTGKTFTQFVNEYRLVHACKLLAEENMSITDTCYASGFNNFSHFNKKFKEFTGKSPSKYRNELHKVVQ
ncbi:helix-turn-helix domain-containing protein [Aureitalea marina]|uniref:AraC family transcriptional regulator n=1 Tax=Aureitalea marina TaxID=930804 RepID=A0A2S7KPM1_9FLAO|nr:AraC family transcriptional regulator [Aureitalea marina]PQB04528.1 AraC family transcriptional regulator [Aureitalea marina]